MNMKLKLLSITAALAATVGLATATPIAPGQFSVPITGTALNPLSATIVANTGVQNFSVTSASPPDTLIGTAQEWVVKNYAGNPFGPAATTFVMQVSLSGAPPNQTAAVIERITNAIFTGFMTDVSFFVQNGAQILPTNADRSGNGAVVAFNFNGTTTTINPGQQSVLLIINTDAPSFTTGNFSIQDGLTANVNGFAPSVPDGGNAVALLGVALVGLEFLRRKLATA